MPPLPDTRVVYRVRLEGLLEGSITQNIFLYQTDGVETASALDLAEAFFGGTLVDNLQAASSDQMHYRTVFVEGVQVNTDIGFASGDEAGGVAVSASPAFVAFAFRNIRLDTAEPQWHKRFPGVPRDWVIDGVLESGHETAMTNIADECAANIIGASTTVYAPVSSRHQQLNLPVVPPQYWSIGGVAFNGVTSQVSRKLGRGI